MYTISRYHLLAKKFLALILIVLSVNVEGALSPKNKAAIKTLFEHPYDNYINDIIERAKTDQYFLKLIEVIVHHWRNGEFENDVSRSLICTALISINQATLNIQSFGLPLFGLPLEVEEPDSFCQTDDAASSSCSCNDVSL